MPSKSSKASNYLLEVETSINTMDQDSDNANRTTKVVADILEEETDQDSSLTREATSPSRTLVEVETIRPQNARTSTKTVSKQSI